MRRLSIEMTPEQHQRLKAIAALSGKSLKQYVLERVLPPLGEENDTEDSAKEDAEEMTEEEALHRLEMFLKPRIEEAERGEFVNQSLEEIFEEAKREYRAGKI